MTNGSLQLSASVKIMGAIPTPGNTPLNPLPPIPTSTSKGASQTIGYGVGSGRASTYALGYFEIPASSSITLDLYAGGSTENDLRDMFGFPAPFRRIKSINVYIESGATDGVRIGGAATNEFRSWFVNAGDQVDIYPNGAPYLAGNATGKDVTSTAKNFKIENLSTTESVYVIVFAAGDKFNTGWAMGCLGGVYP